MYLPNQSASLIQLTDEQFYSLSPAELTQRMDLILRTADVEMYGAEAADRMPRFLVQDFYESTMIQLMECTQQKESLLLAWEFLCQLSILNRLSGFANHLIYNNHYHEDLSWKSPTNHLRNAVINQSGIVLSRIAFERLMNLIYFVITGKSLDSGSPKKSKKREFFIYLNKADWTWRYFLYLQSIVQYFDDKHRTGEVHKKSKILRQIVRLNRPNDADQNKQFILTNLMHNLWLPLLEILNEKIPSTIYGEPSLLSLIEIIHRRDQAALNDFCIEQKWLVPS